MPAQLRPFFTLADGATARLRCVVLEAENGQTRFPLELPYAGGPARLNVNGVLYEGPHLVFEDESVVWASKDFALDDEDEIELHYYVKEG